MEKHRISRRNLLGMAGMGAVGAAAGIGASALASRSVDAAAPKWPGPYQTLDPEEIRKLAHQGYYKGACMYGAFGSIVSTLGDKVGAPYNLIPLEMMKYGEGGIAGWGSLCGGLNGACAAINLVAGKDYKKLVNELTGWYTQEKFPSETSNSYAKNHQFLVKKYKSDKVLPGSISDSTLCHVSVTNWCKASGYASGSKERSERCGRLTGDVAARAVELLNAHAAGKFKPAFAMSAVTQGCRGCHIKGKDFKKGHFTRGKENCTECHTPHPVS